MSNLILKAARFAALCHTGQTRKYGSNQPYIVHPGRVAARIMREPWANEAHAATAWLHDVIEDCNVTHEQLVHHFGVEVADMVSQLTNKSKSIVPPPSRAERKRIDREHIATLPWWVKAIKLADRTDNLTDIINADTDFVHTYYRESQALLPVLLSEGPVEALVADYKSALKAIEETFLDAIKEFTLTPQVAKDDNEKRSS